MNLNLSLTSFLQKLTLHIGSETYDMWIEPSVPIYFEIYVWDLKNQKDVENGSKPLVEQKGPYVYKYAK